MSLRRLSEIYCRGLHPSLVQQNARACILTKVSVKDIFRLYTRVKVLRVIVVKVALLGGPR